MTSWQVSKCLVGRIKKIKDAVEGAKKKGTDSEMDQLLGVRFFLGVSSAKDSGDWFRHPQEDAGGGRGNQ